MTALCNARLVLQDAVVTGDIVIDSGRIQSVFVPPAPHDCRCIDLCGLISVPASSIYMSTEEGMTSWMQACGPSVRP